MGARCLRAGVDLNPHNDVRICGWRIPTSPWATPRGRIPAYDRAMALGEWDTEAANNAAWLRAVRGQNLDRALEIALALTRDGQDPNHLDTLGWVYYRRGDYRRAAEALERALKLKPGLVEAIYHLALVRKAQGDGSGARRVCCGRSWSWTAVDAFGLKPKAPWRNR